MGNFKKVFIIGFVGGLVGYACGAMFTPTRAIAQQSEPADAGAPPQNDPSGTPTMPDAGPPPQPAAGGPSPACRQWEVKSDPRVVYPATGVVVIEEGWEPFSYYGGGGSVILRRCIR